MLRVLRLARTERARVVIVGLVYAVYGGFGFSLIIQIAMVSGDGGELPQVGSLIQAQFGGDEVLRRSGT